MFNDNNPDVRYFVIVNNAAHNGRIEELDMEMAWSSSCPYGWTYQEVCGSFGTVLGEYSTKEEAQEALKAYLICSGRCYTHNPN